MGESRDVYRFDIEQNDLSEAVTLYSFFKGNKSNFAKINSDNRCKIFPFKKFEENIEKSWIIDKWWTEDEKIEIGISEKKEKVGLLEFSSLVEDIAVSISGFQEEIKELSEKKKPELTYSTFKLKDLFSIERGKSKYTKKYGNQNKGEYPVYSASNNAPLTHINTFDYDGEFLTWATNGFAGYIKLLNGKFSFNADRGLLKPLKDKVNITYVKNIIEPILRDLAKGRKGEKGQDEFTKVYPSMIEDVEIKMPIDGNGELDIDSQNSIVEKILFTEEIKSKIESYKTQLNDLIIQFDQEYQYENILISKIFDLPAIKGLTKTFINKNKGEIPVYGGKVEEIPIGYVSDNLKTLKYFENCLAWNREGSVGYVFFHNHKFTTNDHHRPLVLKKEYENKINLEYSRYAIEETLLSQGFKWSKTASKEKVAKLTFKLPVSTSKKIDVDSQNEIAIKLKKTEAIKHAISKELDKILLTNIEFVE